MKKQKIIIGVDEAGRGSLAGPISVAAIAATVNSKYEARNPKSRFHRRYSTKSGQISKFSAKGGSASGGKFLNSKFLKNIKDSKKLSVKKREEWREILCKNFDCQSVLVGSQIIDKIGISRATKIAVARVLRKFKKEPDLVLLDGSMSAPKHYNQKTIIKGDEKVPLIAAASIIAKVRRDSHMLRLHKKFPKYCFDRHKGYATKLHYKMLKKYGFCHFHRRSFCHRR